jgi:dCMP deaminase
MIRPSFHSIYMQLAENLAKRSTCNRLQVGSVICSNDFRQIYAVGYNGDVTGGDHKCDEYNPGNCGCIHSEDNAVINCTEPRGSEKVVFVTHQPCLMCAKRLINLGNIIGLYYKHDYRDKSGIELLQKHNVNVLKYEE